MHCCTFTQVKLKIKVLFIGKHSLQYFFTSFWKISLFRSLRYAAYRQFTWWAHGHLGKNIRRVIPPCAVKKIRATFPAPDGIYTGYIAGDDDDSSYDSELDEAWRDFLNI